MHTSVGLHALAVRYPERIITNHALRERSPALVAGAEQAGLARLWGRSGADVSPAWSRAMDPYLADPFRGGRERRHLCLGEASLDLEIAAARAAITAARLEPGAIDLVISTAFLPDHVGIGHATDLCGALDLECAAFNLESACSSSLVALRVARAMIRAGEAARVLISISCAYSRVADPDDTFGWFLGDGAAAFVVGPVPAGEGVLAIAARHTAETCGAFSFDLEPARDGPAIRLRHRETAGACLAALQDGYIRELTGAALARAGVPLAAIRCFVVNTPTAWFHDYFAAVLGVDPERVISTHSWIGNVGPVLLPANLQFAAHRRRIAPGDLVLAFTIGSASSTAAAVIRWGDVQLGDDPLAGVEVVS